MTGATIKSVYIKTAPSKNDDEETLGYELKKISDDYEEATIIKKLEDPKAFGKQYMLVSGSNIFPDDVQATIKPYIERVGFSHHLNPGSADTVEEQELRIIIETSDEESYQVQKLDEGRYYVSRDNQLVKPPRSVNQKAEQVFPDYEPVL